MMRPLMVEEDDELHRSKNKSRYETLGSRNLMEQTTAKRAKVDKYFGKVSYSKNMLWDTLSCQPYKTRFFNYL